MNARMKRLVSDYEQIKKDFAAHPNIVVTPIGSKPPEKYHVTYFVNGIYLLPDGKIATLSRHEVEITLHAEYPRYKPLCRITTPIWHPNFRDGQICIGDIWGAGESLSDIIVNIGDMIQYKSWNSYSPLSAEAAKWAIENKHLFPVGNINLFAADYASAKDTVEIDLFDENDNVVGGEGETTDASISENDFEITAEDLSGIEFVPAADRMQVLAASRTGGRKINFKTIFMKGLLWAFIGGIVGFAVQELLTDATSSETILRWMGYSSIYDMLDMDIDLASSIIAGAVRVSMAFFSAFVACGLGLFMGIGEGVFYGSKEKALKYAGIGAGVSLGIGFISGYIAQALYAVMVSEYSSGFTAALVRGIGWAIMGLGVGVSVGLIKPEKKRILFCCLGGLSGGFAGGFLFDFIVEALMTGIDDTGTGARAVGIIIMGLLIGLGIGLLEQFAKQAWLKVVRGEFEGKEYLVFAGTTSIGSSGKNTIVLFKDKLVGPHHCDIVLEGGQYVIVDRGTPMGTIVNGQKVMRHVLRQGDAISVGNSVLVFHTK